MAKEAHSRSSSASSASTAEDNNANAAAANSAIATPDNVARSAVIGIGQFDGAGTRLDDNVNVTLTNRFLDEIGQPKTWADVQLKFAHLSGQFRNNQTANAKARASRYAKAQAAGDSAGMAENAPLTVSDLEKLWSTYEADVGGSGQRQSSAERIKSDAGWLTWVDIVADHNAAVARGELIDGPNGRRTAYLHSGARFDIPRRPAKGKGMSDEAHKAALDTWNAAKDAVVERILSMPEHAERVAAHVARLTAAAAAGKTATPAAPVDLRAGIALL